jgi:hypothetical protein
MLPPRRRLWLGGSDVMRPYEPLLLCHRLWCEPTFSHSWHALHDRWRDPASHVFHSWCYEDLYALLLFVRPSICTAAVRTAIYMHRCFSYGHPCATAASCAADDHFLFISRATSDGYIRAPCSLLHQTHPPTTLLLSTCLPGDPL